MFLDASFEFGELSNLKLGKNLLIDHTVSCESTHLHLLEILGINCRHGEGGNRVGWGGMVYVCGVYALIV